MNPTPNERRQCRHSGPPKCAPTHGPGGAGNVKALRHREGQMNCQGRSGVKGGRTHGGAAPGQLNGGAGESFFFGARGGRGLAAVLLPPPHGVPRALVWREGRAAKGCGLRRDRSQEHTMSGKGSKKGILAVIIFCNRIVALFTNSIIYYLGCSSCNYCY
jgi:hypothetical protein